jgi:hypothetical protein
MKTILLFIQLLLVSSAFAQNKSSEDEYECMSGLKEQMNPRNFHAPENRGTLLYYLPSGQTGNLSENQNPALLVIERGALQVCDMSLGRDGTGTFKINDGWGTLKMAYSGAMPHFRPLGYWDRATSRTCKNALDGATEFDAAKVLKRIILQSLKSYLTQKGASAQLPTYCNSAAGITGHDIEMLRRELQGTLQPAAQKSSSNAEQP